MTDLERDASELVREIVRDARTFEEIDEEEFKDRIVALVRSHVD